MDYHFEPRARFGFRDLSVRALWVVAGIWLMCAVRARGQEVSSTKASADGQGPTATVTDSSRHALIVVGLAGDAEHEQQFRAHTAAWTEWLVETGTPPQQILLLRAGGAPDDAAVRRSDRATIERTFRELAERLTENDSLWVFFLGHADYDGQHARFHIPGPDLRAQDYADLLEPLRCRQQVVWLTMSSSGWFLAPLSKANRIVITATQADAEPNDTEFPGALADAMRLPVSQLNLGDGEDFSLLDLLTKTADLIQARYDADQRAVTEHPMIDDNGDRRGTELAVLRRPTRPAGQAVEPEGNEPRADQPRADEPLVAEPAAIPIDGKLARELRLRRGASTTEPAAEFPATARSESAPPASAESASPESASPEPASAGSASDRPTSEVESDVDFQTVPE